MLIDKPSGLSSHDVVARVRRALGTRQVGHAGTLDPMATGLLVVLVGDGTRLSSHLTASSKRYRAVVVLGEGTDSLDADGASTGRAPVPRALREDLAARRQLLGSALEIERTRAAQIPPSISAIHTGGERAYERARRGEEVVLAPRPVCVHALTVLSIDALAELPRLEIDLCVSKGYYVRSMARDLGLSLGLPAHLGALRRLSSGAFDVAEAIGLDDLSRLPAALRPLAEVAGRALPSAALSESGTRRARLGQRLGRDDFESEPPGGVAAWFSGAALVALGEYADGEGRVVRGFPSGLG